MKYVSPICEIEAFETEDIMVLSENVDGGTVYFSEETKDAIIWGQTGADKAVDQETGETVENSFQFAVSASGLGLGSTNTNQ